MWHAHVSRMHDSSSTCILCPHVTAHQLSHINTAAHSLSVSLLVCHPHVLLQHLMPQLASFPQPAVTHAVKSDTRPGEPRHHTRIM
jgi:hypothetical protein